MQNIQYPNRLMMNKLTDTPLKTFSKESEEQLSTYEKLTRCAALCSTAYLLNDDTNMRKPILDRECKGDASEAALVKFVETRNDCATLKEVRQEFTEIFALPFNSKNKYMISVVKNNQQQSNHGKVTLLMKGAPERVFQRCSYIQVNGKTLPMDDTWKDAFQDAYNFMASKGERVLGFAQALVDEHVVQQGKEQQENDNPFALQLEGLVFLGICGLSDPPKVGVTEAIHKCKTAGVQVVMVTGDHPATAKAIAKQVGIIENNAKTIEDIAEEEGLDLKNIKEIPYSRTDAVVLNGEEIDKLSDKDWSQILKKKQIVFSRTSPQQKLLIVSKFQAVVVSFFYKQHNQLGHCVAVTGDGTNDSPALKKADIGVAMNISGSAVSKEAAALILLDDNFASIVNGVQEGRLIFDNLKKSIAYTLTHLFPEIGPFLAYVVFGLPLPLTGLLVLCIDLGTELVAAVSLAFENAESDIMHVPPRSRHDSLVGAPVLSYSYLQMGMIETMACFMNYFFVFAHYGIPPKYLWWAAKNGYFSSDTKTDLFITETGLYISPSLQLNILNTAQTAYFLGVVVCQWITLFCTKTRRVSIFTHGIFGNLVVYLGIIFAVCLLCIFVYCPFIGDFIFQSRYLVIDFWLYPLPWMAFMFFYDELRKLCIRKLNLSFLFW